MGQRTGVGVTIVCSRLSDGGEKEKQSRDVKRTRRDWAGSAGVGEERSPVSPGSIFPSPPSENLEQAGVKTDV